MHEVLTRRRLARQLYVEGLEVADIAAALGVSSRSGPAAHQRAARRAAGHREAAAPACVLRAHASHGDAQLGELEAPPTAVTPIRGRAAATRTGAARPARHRFRHEALLYRGDEAFLRARVPFIEQGLDLGHAVMVAVPEPRLDAGA